MMSRVGHEHSGADGGFERAPGVRVLFKRLRRSHSTGHSHRLSEKALFCLLVTVVVYQALVDLLSLCMYLQGRGGAAGLSKDPFPVASVTRRLAGGSQGANSQLRVRCERLGGGVVSSGAPEAPPIPSSGESGDPSQTVAPSPADRRPEVDAYPGQGSSPVGPAEVGSSPVGPREEDPLFVGPPPPYEEVQVTGEGVVHYGWRVDGGNDRESPPPYTPVDPAPPRYTSGPPPHYDDTYSGTDSDDSSECSTSSRREGSSLREALYRHIVASMLESVTRIAICLILPVSAILMTAIVYGLLRSTTSSSQGNSTTVNASTVRPNATVSL